MDGGDSVGRQRTLIDERGEYDGRRGQPAHVAVVDLDD